MFGTPSSNPFGTPSSTPAFGTPSTPAFGATPSTPAFGTPSSQSAFGTPSSTPAFGTPSSTPAFGTPSTTPAFGGSAFGATPSSTPAFGSSIFNTPQSAPSFGTPSTPAFTNPSSSLFPQQQQQQQLSPSPFLLNGQITTQMAPVAPLPFSLPDRDIQAIVDGYREEPDNRKYAFRHLLFSVTEPQARAKPVSVPNTMWAEAMRKLEGMENSDRERLWPQLVQGFKDLSIRLKLQDEVIASDAERLKMTRSNVKMLQMHFQVDTEPWIQRLKQQELTLQRRLLKIMRIIETLENKGLRIPLTNEEVQLHEKLLSMAKQIRGPASELSKRVYNLMSVSRVLVNSGQVGQLYVPGSAKVDDQSLLDLQEVLLQQTDAIARLGNVLKRDARDLEIITVENMDVNENGVSNKESFFGPPGLLLH